MAAKRCRQGSIDPCAGSATTLRAAKELNRHSFGFEIDKKFYKAANEQMLNVKCEVTEYGEIKKTETVEVLKDQLSLL